MVMSRFTKLLKRADDLSDKYEVAFQKNQAEIVELEEKLKVEKAKMTDFHKAYILQEITDDAYLEQRKVVETIAQDIKNRQAEAGSIGSYKAEDVAEIVAEINKEKPEINQKQQKEIEKVKQDLEKARNDYLNKVTEIGKSYDKAVKGENLLQELLVKLGTQRDVYTPDKYEILQGIGEVSDETINNYL